LKTYSRYLQMGSRQFGFKLKTGCNDALYTINKTVDYFTNRTSNVIICSLVVAKAFDKVDKYVLFDKLMLRRCPSKFIRILNEWYRKSETLVNWNGCLSPPVSLVSGVRQGSWLAGYLLPLCMQMTYCYSRHLSSVCKN